LYGSHASDVFGWQNYNKKGIQGQRQAGKHWIRLIDYFHALSLQNASISVIYFPVPAGCPNH
jgi:hypothetical protein